MVKEERDSERDDDAPLTCHSCGTAITAHTATQSYVLCDSCHSPGSASDGGGSDGGYYHDGKYTETDEWGYYVAREYRYSV